MTIFKTTKFKFDTLLKECVNWHFLNKTVTINIKDEIEDEDEIISFKGGIS